jgi:hypothetical protein
MQTRDEDMVPLTINCWPSVSGGESYVNIEYESNADYDLQNVTIAIPISSPPTVNQVRTGAAGRVVAGALATRRAAHALVLPAVLPPVLPPVLSSKVKQAQAHEEQLWSTAGREQCKALRLVMPAHTARALFVLALMLQRELCSVAQAYPYHQLAA